MNTNAECKICKTSPIHSEVIPNKDGYFIECPVCGQYNISRPLNVSVTSNTIEPYLMSGIIRYLSERNSSVELTMTNINAVIESVRFPHNPFDKIDLLLEYLSLKQKKINDEISLVNNDYSVAFAEDSEEFWFLIGKAIESGYVEEVKGEKINYRLTMKGWSKVITKQDKSLNKNAFVAMWFDNKMENVWQSGIKQALIETGYNPIRIDDIEHNGKICDRIIAEINKCALVVADFTGHRGGVYFEAGYALGKGLPVIWTCNQEYIDSAHFDTRQYNHILWESHEQLKIKLINRISALEIARK
ncbi:hypothetical protein QA601_14295 [Chitinispirillales bacterium ANBcel5]|uniref:hypothetical protein n=1 Tax=Cellulosispirillum alkaliphilum TaxID=3039283 RepID=UPI002A52C447|nr:hypothetical protein [Chitinispirillales bacterium ANBcel5]